VIPYLAMLIVLIMSPALQSTAALQIALVLGLPLLVAWLLFHAPMLAPAANRSYARFLRERLPQTIVSVNLALACIMAVALPLVMISIRACPILPLTFWTLIIWWEIIALGAVPAVLLLWLHEGWALKRGLRSWSVAALGEGDVRTASWRSLWWWIPLSYAALLGGIFVGSILSRLAQRG
jgi:hypothetical protein